MHYITIHHVMHVEYGNKALLLLLLGILLETRPPLYFTN